jgi:hypothetical protein
MQNGSIMQSERRRTPTFGNTDGETLEPMANASTGGWSSERLTGSRARPPRFVHRVRFAEISIWPTCDAKLSL